MYTGGTTLGLSTIAEETGADVGTVSRVLRGLAGEYRISAKRAKLIRRTAKELGYRPNFHARAQARGRFQTVGLLIREHRHNWIPTRLLEGIQEALGERGLALNVCSVGDRDAAEDRVPDMLSHAMVDGLLVMAQPWQFTDKVLQQIERGPVPAVWIASDKIERGVCVANEAASHQATEYLLKLGHKRIEMVGFPDEGTKKATRYEGYKDAMRRHGLEAHIIPTGDTTLIAQVGERLDRPDRPTALLCHSRYQATSVLLAANQRQLRIPRDLSLMQMGPRSEHGPEMITAMVLDEHRRGRIAVDMLIEEIDNPGAEPTAHFADLEFVDAGTCAPPPETATGADGKEEKRTRKNPSHETQCMNQADPIERPDHRRAPQPKEAVPS